MRRYIVNEHSQTLKIVLRFDLVKLLKSWICLPTSHRCSCKCERRFDYQAHTTTTPLSIYTTQHGLSDKAPNKVYKFKLWTSRYTWRMGGLGVVSMCGLGLVDQRDRQIGAREMENGRPGSQGSLATMDSHSWMHNLTCSKQWSNVFGDSLKSDCRTLGICIEWTWFLAETIWRSPLGGWKKNMQTH
jgi:hypothetical protein